MLQTIDALYVVATPLLTTLAARAQQWRAAFGTALCEWASREVSQLGTFFATSEAGLRRPCKTLADLAAAMANVGALRSMEAAIDMKLVRPAPSHGKEAAGGSPACARPCI